MNRTTTNRRGRRLNFEARAIIIGLAIVVSGWMLGFFAVYFGYFHTVTMMPEGESVRLPIISSPFHPHTEKIVSSGSPLLIFTCQRANYLNRTLENVYASISRPQHDEENEECRFGCPIIVSEDGEHADIRSIVLSYRKKFEVIGIPLVHMHHPQKKKILRSTSASYVALARHYGWALSEVFAGKAGDSSFSLPHRVIILEEDIQVAPDFFSYMESTSSILDNDSTLFAVSAFNDNGHVDNGDPKRLLRSDFFPGLGWMMTRDLWINELQKNWAPDGYWDDWLRDSTQRKGRQVIRPEISRTYHFGTEGGVSGNQFGSILEQVKLDEKPIRWEMEDLSYLENSLYKTQYIELVTNSKLATTLDEAEQMSKTGNVRIEYDSYTQFRIFAKKIGIMDDEKAKVPRTAYNGIVETRRGNNLLFLIPKGGIVGYK